MMIVPLITLPAVVALALWARWLGRHDNAPRFVRYLPWGFLGTWLLVTIGWAVDFVTSRGSVSGESVDPSQKARILAEGISETINIFGCSIVLIAAGAIAMLLLTWRYHWATPR